MPAMEKKLGELLVDKKLISKEELEIALKQQEKEKTTLVRSLAKLGLMKESATLPILAEALDVPYVNLREQAIDFDFSKKLSEVQARRLKALLIKEQEGGYQVGMVSPEDIHALDALKQVLKKKIYPVLVNEADLLHTLDLIYRRTEEIQNLAEALEAEMGGAEVPTAELVFEEGQVDAPVVKLLQSVFADAVQVNASDIHIEPDEKVLRIRLRIDGVLHEQIMQEKQIATAISLRLKLMAGLNISEKRLPQDGRFYIKVRDKVIDVRLSIMPTQYGESIVMRLLDQSSGLLKLDQIGMPESILNDVRRLFHMPNGILLVTGPTGSGKTTTLYAALNELNTPDKNIMTVEDPVEYRLPRINQIQVNDKLGLTFARVLRTTLRQDPNVIMVGEMRDEETASIAMRAALTGHLVISTLHTNDSISSAIRLLDMKIEGYLVAATVRGILAQRLTRVICESCKADYTLTDHERSWLTKVGGEASAQAHYFYGKGCTYCNKTGYKGRMGVFELLELNASMMDALRDNDTGRFEKEAREALKGKLLLNHALNLAAQGKTTVSEVIRILGEIG